MEMIGLMVLKVVVVIGLFDLVTAFLLHYLMPLVIEHPFLGYPLNAIAVLVGLLLLRDGLAIPVLPGTVFIVTLFLYLSIRPHGRRAHKGLADIGAAVAPPVQISVS